jgi:Flp pilus assembly protein TadG
MIRRLRSLKGFGRDERGVSALEFALIAPVLILMYTGMAELSQGMTAQRRATHAASTLGDLVAQQSSITSYEAGKVLAAAKLVMMPFPTTTLKTRLTSISADGQGKITVDWSKADGLSAYGKTATITVPTGLLAANESLVMAEAQYTYTSPIASVLPKPLVFSEKFYLKPRKNGKVTCSDCT